MNGIELCGTDKMMVSLYSAWHRRPRCAWAAAETSRVHIALACCVGLVANSARHAFSILDFLDFRWLLRPF